ncbi:MAG: ATP-binding cassette domain-containing protein, partial [Candidatus Thorarchaeota archaeon]|nr:ATP-binding cassette domain-containing protein [Candidatus Thorarchaeota archaeon]
RFYDADRRDIIEYNGYPYKVDDKGKVKVKEREFDVVNGKVTIDNEEYSVIAPGKMYIDNLDIAFFGIENLRASIGMVHQDPFLFSATIKENIAFAKPDAGMEEVIAAAKAANIHDFIETLDLKYDAIVGERGVTLSGGQKQRIAIARALLADPKILILDDSTSSVDAKTEMLIQKALETLMEGRTTFIITHRLSTVRNADLIVMMEHGRILEMGSHQELLNRGGLYEGIYKTLEEMEMAALSVSGGVSNE